MIRLFRGGLVALCVLLISACGQDKGFDAQALAVPTGYLRVVNAVPDSPQLNFYVNDRLVQNLNFGVSSSFLGVLPDAQLRLSVNYVVAGELVPLLTDEPLYVDIDGEVTIIVSGTLANPIVSQIPDPPRAIAADQLELRFSNNASTVANPVTMTLRSGTDVISQTTLLFGEASGPLSIAGGNYTITVTDSVTNSAIWASGAFSLTAGVRRIFSLIDYFGPGSGTARLISISEQGASNFANEDPPAALRIANMTPDQGPLDIYINDVLFASNLAFGTVTDYLDVTKGSVTIDVRPFGDALTRLSETSVTISPGIFHTLAVSGLADTNGVQLYRDDRRRVDSRLLLVAIAAAPSSPTADLYVLNPGESIDNTSPRVTSLIALPSNASTQILTLQAGTYDLVFTELGNKTVLAGPTRIDVSNGGLYSFYLTDKSGGGEPFEIVFADDF